MNNPEAEQDGYDPTPRSTRRDAVLRDSDLKAYVDKLYHRLPTYAELAADIAPEAPGSVEWLGRIGKLVAGSRTSRLIKT